MATPVLNDYHNYLRLEILLSTCGNFAAKKIFRSRYIDLTGNEWEDCSKATKEFLAYIQSTLKKTQKIQRIQKESIEKGDVMVWDLSTIFLVLRTMCSYKKSYIAQSDSDTDATKIETENNLIAQLIKVRNSIMHSPGQSVCPSDFKLWWETAAQALLALGVFSEDIENVRTSKDLNGIEFKNVNDEAMNAQNVVTAMKLREDGNIAKKANQFVIAIQLYTKALRLYGLPKIERAILCSNRSHVYLLWLMEVRDTPTPEDEVDLICNLALQDAVRAIDLRPTWFKGYLRQAKVHKFKKEWKPAIMSFEQALGLNFGCVGILKARDVCRMELTQAQCKDYLNPTEILDRTSTQEFIDKMCSDRGAPHISAKHLCKENAELLISKDPRLKSQALIFLAYRYTHGIDGYPQDSKMAFKLCKEAEVLGDPEAMYTLGNMYQLGIGVPIDIDVAVKLYEKSIRVCFEKKNYADISQGKEVDGQHKLGKAQCFLGRCYVEGVGKPVDHSKAAKLYSLASKNSNGEAAYTLGCLFYEGHGVIQSNERATQYWKLAAKRGVVMSLENLAWTNLLWNNLNMAELHFSFALKASPILTSFQKKEFYDKLSWRRQWNKVIKNKMSSLNDHQYQDNSPLFQHNGSTKRNDDSAASAELRIFDDEFHSYGVIDTDLIKKTNEFDATEETEEKAALGFPYATKILTSILNLREVQLRLDFLKNITKDSHPHFNLTANACSISKTKTELLGYLADHYRASLLPHPLPDSFSPTLREITTETMKLWNHKESEMDCNARICYSFVTFNYSKETVNFLTVCQLKYPQETFFPILHSSILGFKLKNKEEEALNVVIRALNKFPGDVELLSLKAEFLYITLLCTKYRRQEDEDTKLAIEEVMSAFNDFIKVAPPDHPKLPNAYYIVGFLSHTNLKVHPISNTESLKNLEKYLELGLEAEKNAISYFLPQDENAKQILETMIHKLRSELLSEGLADLSVSSQNSTSNSKPKETKIQLETVGSGASYIQQTDPNRIDTVRMHRNAPKMIQNSANTRKGTQLYVAGFTLESLNTQELPSKLAELKEIVLEEMDPLTDHVYNGRVLQNVTIVEESHFHVFPSIVSVLMDSNGEFQRCSFINFDRNDDQVRKHLSFGSKLSIINPYYRLSMDGGCAILIEDPQSVVFHSAGDEEPLCRFCLAKNPQKSCIKCKTAKYCSKQCQKYDWKILRHKRICRL